jgi:serine/threonine protein kinase
VKIERKLLEVLHHPNLIHLEWAFHSEDRIFFVMPFIQGGDLFFHLKKEKRFKEDKAKFFAA